jgi:signal transduction histidine kinase/CheY-like chemotaxis protein/streptogramin lyase
MPPALRSIVAAWFVFAAASLFAPDLLAQRYRFREYRQDQGLGNLAATALLQTTDRYLWIGTQNGLFRYDGARFEPYNQSQGLPSAFVLGLAQGPDGTLWISTHTGIAHRTAKGFETDVLYQRPVDSPGAGLHVAADGTVYAAQPDSILMRRPAANGRAAHFETVPLPQAARGKLILQLTSDDQSHAWFGCADSLCSLDPGSREITIHGPDWKLPKDHWDGAHWDRRGRLWVRSNQALWVLNPERNQFERPSVQPQNFDLPLIFEDQTGDLFFPAGDGLWIHNPSSDGWSHVGPENGLNGELASAVIRDHENGLWIAFLGDGVIRWQGYQQWEGWTRADGLNSNTVWCLRRDNSGILWAGTDNGVNYFDSASRRWRSLAGENGKRLGRVMRFSREVDGTFFAASTTVGLVRIFPNSFRFEILGLPATPRIQTLQESFLDRDNVLWLGTSAGVFTADPKQPLRWTPAISDAFAPRETIYTVSQDSMGNIWAAGSEGVAFRRNGRWQRIREGTDAKTSLLSNQTWYAVETRPRSVWVGYLGTSGATRIELPDRNRDGAPPRITQFQRSSGLGSNMVFSAGTDLAGRQWFGTDRGILVAEKSRIHHLQDRDGLLWNDCNSNALFTDLDGSIWIGTTKGLAHAWPDKVLAPLPSHVRLDGIEVNGKWIDIAALAQGEPLRVPARPNSVELRFSPLTFRYEGRMEFGVRLGLDDDAWTESTNATVNFTGLPSGELRLQARTRQDAILSWQPNLLDIPVQVDAPFWQGAWGRTILGLLAAATVAVFWRYRHQKLIAERARLARAVSDGTSEIRTLLEKAEEANRLKSEFLANMSHEIRTPMNGVLGMLQLMGKTPLNEEQQTYVHVARSSAESLLGLLNEVLDLSKAESGHIEVEHVPFQPREILNQVLALMEGMAQSKGILLTGTCDANVPEQILGDPMRLRQVLTNLTNNAVKFTDSGFVRIEVHCREAHVNFSVEDSGIGIAADKLDLIFEAFRQADGSTTRRFGGTGLGLAISKRLVEIMGGDLAVESTLGLGSRFYFALPLATPRRSGHALQTVGAQTKQPPATSVLPPLRILLAEDNRVNQMVVLRMLERGGHTVLLATDGATAAEMALKEPLDAVLMDVHMPILDGVRATLRIREAEAATGRRLPIAALTAGVLNEERERCMAAGMDAFLAKPIQEEALLATLAELVTPSNGNPSSSAR